MIGKRISSEAIPGRPVYGRTLTIDQAQLPPEFLKPDEEKIRAALDAGDVIPGIVPGKDALLGVIHSPDPMVSNPGEYMKRPDGTGWDAITPTGNRCFFAPEEVVENEDGSISIAAIIVEREATVEGKLTTIELWRGSLVAGDWREEA